MTRRYLPILMIVFAATLMLSAMAAANLSAGVKAPDFTLPTIDSKSFTLSDCFKGTGKVVVLDIWATTCPPCRAEIPYLVDIYKTYENKDVVFVGVALDRSKERVKSFINDLKVSYITALDPGGEKIGADYKVVSIPATYIIDRKGTIRAVHGGFPPSNKDAQRAAAAEIKKDVKELLAEK